MYKVKSGQHTVEVDFKTGDKLTGTLNGKPFEADLSVDGRFLHLLKDGKSWNAEILSYDSAARTVSLILNGKIISLKVNTRLDELMERMGFSDATARKLAELKAPMPGLVLSIKATEGQEIKKGEPLLVLEAMKMENIIKAAADVVVKQIKIKQGQAVEKNQVLITFA
jgi:acetyl/propionyl-CoA carboxylase alpha subunit